MQHNNKTPAKDSVTLLGEFFKKIIGNTRFLCYNVIDPNQPHK